MATPKLTFKNCEKTDWGVVLNFEVGKSIGRFALYTYDDDIYTIYLANLRIAERYRGKGIGNWILNWVFQYARTNNRKQIILRVESGSWMEAWYVRKGFNYLQSAEDGSNWLRKNL